MTLGPAEPPYLNSDLLAEIGVRYVGTRQKSLKQAAPADHINQGFVLGNKLAFGSVNASRADFERGSRTSRRPS